MGGNIAKEVVLIDPIVFKLRRWALQSPPTLPRIPKGHPSICHNLKGSNINSGEGRSDFSTCC